MLIDIDGVLTVSWEPVPGAAEALARIQRAGLGTRLVTNTTSRTRAQIAELLGRAGLEVDASTILTAPAATAGYLAEHYPGARCLLLNSGDIREDLGDVEFVEGLEQAADVRAVVVGKPAAEFFATALRALDAPAAAAVMVGDDIESDVLGSFADLPALLGVG